jgi:hypothetical protein
VHEGGAVDVVEDVGVGADADERLLSQASARPQRMLKLRLRGDLDHAIVARLIEHRLDEGRASLPLLLDIQPRLDEDPQDVFGPYIDGVVE